MDNWKGKLIGAGMTILTAFAIGSFGFAWKTNADMAVIQAQMTEVKLIVKELSIKADEQTRLILSSQGVDEVLDNKIGNLEKRVDRHMDKRDAHQ
jgi:hypothetical protein